MPWLQLRFIAKNITRQNGISFIHVETVPRLSRYNSLFHVLPVVHRIQSMRTIAVIALLAAGLQQPAFAQYVPPNASSCSSGFTYSAGVCVHRGGGGNAYEPRPGSCFAGFTYRPRCVFHAAVLAPMPTGRPASAPAPGLHLFGANVRAAALNPFRTWMLAPTRGRRHLCYGLSSATTERALKNG